MNIPFKYRIMSVLKVEMGRAVILMILLYLIDKKSVCD